MSIPFYSIRSIVEEKISSYLSDNITGVTVHKGITDEVRVLPLIITYAEGAKGVDSLGSHPLGNFVISLKVYVYSSADDETLDTHRERVQTVINLMEEIEAIQALWNPTTDGILYDLWIASDEEGMHQRRYGNVLEFNVWGVVPTAP